MYIRSRRGPASRRAYTLIELLVVIAIMAMLTTLAVTGLGTAHGWMMAGNTERTLLKLHAKLDKLHERTVQNARALDPDPTRFPVANQMYPNVQSDRDRRAMKVIQLKELLVYRFPTNFGEIYRGQQAGDPDATSMWESLPQAEKDRVSAAGYTPKSTETATCLALIYARIGNLDSFTPHELRDTDGDGLREVLDAWGTPFLFYRYGYVGGVPASIRTRAQEVYPPAQFQRRDPDDPEGLLRNVSGSNEATFQNAFGYRPRDATYYAPLVIVSAGPDRRFGTADDLDSYRLKLSLAGQ